MISLTPEQLTVLRPAAAPPAYVIEAYRAASLAQIGARVYLNLRR
jgi:hypothetical protein